MKTTYDHVIARNFYLNLFYKEQGVECLLSTNTGSVIHFFTNNYRHSINIYTPLHLPP
ncbi:hypothetical protein Plhal304r1_c004g0018601 [Plasmopara halstedii]